MFSENGDTPSCFQGPGDKRWHTEGQKGILKNGKATGIDAINSEMLKVDWPTSVGVLSPFFNEVWERDEMPKDWRKGLIVKIPKKRIFLSVTIRAE